MRRRRRGWVAALGALGTLGTVALVGPAIWTSRAASGRVVGVDEARERALPPVALVLGAGVQPDGNPSPFLAGRLDVARALYDSGQVGALILSGDNRAEHHSEPEAMRRYLLARGVPSEQIVLDEAGYDTYDSCSRAQRVFGVDRLVVVSQTYHLPRALAICQALGLDAVGVGDDSVRRFASVWTEGELREYAANLKAVVDVTARRDPVLEPPTPAVQEALARRPGR